MTRFFQKLIRSENGQALPIVLALLAIGGLTIAVNLNYATTSLNGTKMLGENVKGIYAANSGIEDSLWALSHNGTPATQLSENINGMPVTIQTQNLGTFTLYFGEMIDVEGVHVSWLDVQGAITATNVSDRYQYDTTITWQAPTNKKIKLIEVGSRLPLGYTYVTDSAASFPSNMSTSNPSSITTDSFGAYMLKWTWSSGHGPELTESDPLKTESFYIDGSGSLSGAYAWVVAQDNDVGTVGEITGTRYKITANATRALGGKITAIVTAEAIVKDDGTMQVVSWQIAK